MSQVVNPQEYGIELKKANELTGSLDQIKSERKVLIEQYDEVVKMDIEDPKTSKLASELRKRIKDNRTKGIEVWHKNTKDYFLKGGQFVDAIKRLEISINERMEDNLELIEKHQALKEQKMRDELKSKRISELYEYRDFVPSGIDLGTMSEEEYRKIYNGAKLQFDAKVAEDLRIEEEKLESQRLDKIENSRRLQISPYVQSLSDFTDLRSMSESEYSGLLESLVTAKKEYDEEQEKIRLENERLVKEAEDKKAEDRRRGELLKPLLAFVTDYTEMLLLTKEDFEVKLKELNKEKKAQDDFEASEILRKKNEMKAREKDALEFLLSEGFIQDVEGVRHSIVHYFIGNKFYSELESESEIKAFKSETSLNLKNLLDKKADEEKKAKEKQDAIDAENLAKAPVKKQLKAWIDQFKLPETSVDNEVSKEIIAKFESFRTWSVKVVDNL